MLTRLLILALGATALFAMSPSDVKPTEFDQRFKAKYGQYPPALERAMRESSKQNASATMAAKKKNKDQQEAKSTTTGKTTPAEASGQD